MLLAAYILFALGVGWALRHRDLAERRPWLVRGATTIVALLIGIGAAAWLTHLVRSPENSWSDWPLAYLLTGSLLLGAVAYVAATWAAGALALAVRRAGWGLMALALLVPSTFALALPLLVPLALTLGGEARARKAVRPEHAASS